MSVQLEIPDELIAAIKIPLPELKRELTKELAFVLYARWALSMGKARQMAGLTKREFLHELASRRLERHYTTKELSEDIAYAEGSE